MSELTIPKYSEFDELGFEELFEIYETLERFVAQLDAKIAADHASKHTYCQRNLSRSQLNRIRGLLVARKRKRAGDLPSVPPLPQSVVRASTTMSLQENR